MINEKNNSITIVPGIRVGHATDADALTGCTVVLCEKGTIGGVDQRGGATGSRQIDSLHPIRLVEEVHAILLSGGSAFGLNAATGVMRYLEEQGVGVQISNSRIPIVPTAILFDLSIGKPSIRPDAKMGYQSCLNANNNPVLEGNVGAGCGATAGKILGIHNAVKTGIGSAGMELRNGLYIGAIIAVNSFGDVIEPGTGKIIAGARIAEENQFANTLNVMKTLSDSGKLRGGNRSNTVIGVVATNAKFNKEQINKVAQMAQSGVTRAIRPAHTMFDGDTIFALATGYIEADENIIGAFASEMVTEAIIRAVLKAEPAGGLPSASVI